MPYDYAPRLAARARARRRRDTLLLVLMLALPGISLGTLPPAAPDLHAAALVSADPVHGG